MSLRFTSLRLAGWKSIKDATIQFRPRNIFIGGNGAGKSNLISFFKLLNEMIGGRLQLYVQTHGGAESLFHHGTKSTSQIECEFAFSSELGTNRYSATWVAGRPIGLVFESEVISFQRTGFAQPLVRDLGSGHLESRLAEVPAEFEQAERFFRGALGRCRVFHFHDTTLQAGFRRECSVNQNRILMPFGENLPAMLYLYRQQYPTAYQRIRAAVRSVMPYFDDFVLEPLRLDPNKITLEWRTLESSGILGAHQLSDGTIRFIALATVLLQPDTDRPELLILDEPELGLHPAALSVLADLLLYASERSCLLVATQSSALLNHFDAEDILTVTWKNGQSTFERPDPAGLERWLKDYTLGELWEQNVLGGGPY